jgi:hypothetical protein
VLCSTLLLGSCSDSDSPSAPGIRPPTLEELLGAPDTLAVDSLHFVLLAQLARDFMPFGPPDGRPLGGLLTLSELDQRRIPPAIHVPTAWVIHGTELWRVDPTPLDSELWYQLLGSVGEGPKWGPEIYVDVTVRITDGKGGVFLLRAPHQWIERVE